MLGHVNNAVYMTYLEEARIEFLYQALSLNSMPFIMASARMDYVRQAFSRVPYGLPPACPNWPDQF